MNTGLERPGPAVSDYLPLQAAAYFLKRYTAKYYKYHAATNALLCSFTAL